MQDLTTTKKNPLYFWISIVFSFRPSKSYSFIHILTSILSYFSSSPEDMLFSLLSEREGGRKRNINVREKHPLATSHVHLDQGSNPQPRHTPWLGIKPTTFFWLRDDAPANWAILARARTNKYLRNSSHMLGGREHYHERLGHNPFPLQCVVSNGEANMHVERIYVHTHNRGLWGGRGKFIEANCI